MSVALAELNDTEGADLDEIEANYRAKRGAKFCAADLKAVRAFHREHADAAYGVAALDSTTDRLEGPVPKAVDLRTSASLTICVVPFEALVSGFVSPQAAIEAQLVLGAGEEP